jgi:hypothetical protein
MIGLARMAMKRAYALKWDDPPDRRCGCSGCHRYFTLIDAATKKFAAPKSPQADIREVMRGEHP